MEEYKVCFVLFHPALRYPITVDKALLKRSETFTAVFKPKLLALAKGKGEKKNLEEMENLVSMECL